MPSHKNQGYKKYLYYTSMYLEYLINLHRFDKISGMDKITAILTFLLSAVQDKTGKLSSKRLGMLALIGCGIFLLTLHADTGESLQMGAGILCVMSAALIGSLTLNE